MSKKNVFKNMKTKRLVQSDIFEGKKLSLGTVCRCQKKENTSERQFFCQNNFRTIWSKK
jgi:hypothetical protein